MLNTYARLAALLDELERELKTVALWELEMPSASALASRQPFAHDTLRFSQWLQFLFIARLRSLIAAEALLPDNCSVLPMAEESFKGMAQDMSRVQGVIGEIDRLLSNRGSLH